MKKINYKKLLRKSVLGALLLASGSLSAQVIPNPSFESLSPNNVPLTGSPEFLVVPSPATIDGWNALNGPLEVHHERHRTQGCPVGGGVQHVDLNDFGSIETTITDLYVNGPYTITFWTRTHDILTSSQTASAMVRIYDGSGNMLNQGWSTLADAAGDTWVQRSYSFTATSTTATLEFSGTGAPTNHGGILLDGIDIQFDYNECSGSTLTYTQDCNDFTFNFSSPNIEIKGGFWTVDGVETTIGTDAVHIEGGTHEVCYNYIGYDKLTKNVCCNSACVTVNAPTIKEYSEVNASYCELFGGYAYNPCSGTSFTSYSITVLPDDGAPTIIVPCASPVPVLPEGNYLIKYYDANGCVRGTRSLNITQIDLVTRTCEKIVYDDCYSPVDPESIFPDPTDCPDCYNTAINSTSQSLGNLIGTGPNGYPLYVNVFTDETNCEVCSLTFELQPGPCDFELDFDVQEDPNNPHTFFFNIAINNNYPYPVTQCLDELIITDDNGGGIIYQGSLPGSYFLSPGDYTLCWTVRHCDYSCSPPVECSKTVCESITVTSPIPQNGGSNSTNDADGLGGSLTDFVGIKLVPNPSSSRFKILRDDFDGTTYDKVMIYTMDGKVVFEKKQMDVNHMYDLSAQAAGTYIVAIEINGKVFKEKLSLNK